ncbi:hypothetical protein JXR93_05615, partial [bacterium]|nr:hypothetical protein [bacterium]
EFFEKLERKNIKIIIDGSNVAWNSNSQKNSDYPELKNISLVVKALKKQNINDITVIIDAALMHKVKDPEFYKEFEDIIHKAPAKIEADYFIIDFARKGSGLIITNDQFKDWKERDSWIQENIDSMLIPFMILNNYVTFGKTFDNSNSLLNKYTKNTNMTTQVITDDNSTSKDKKDILLELFDSHQKKGGLFLKEFERLYIEKFGNSFENFNTFKEFLEFNFKNFEITFKFNKHNLFVKKRVFSKDS